MATSIQNLILSTNLIFLLLRAKYLLVQITQCNNFIGDGVGTILDYARSKILYKRNKISTVLETLRSQSQLSPYQLHHVEFLCFLCELNWEKLYYQSHKFTSKIFYGVRFVLVQVLVILLLFIQTKCSPFYT